MRIANFTELFAYKGMRMIVLTLCVFVSGVSAPVFAQVDPASPSAATALDVDPLIYAKEARLCRQVNDPDWFAGRTAPKDKTFSDTYNAWDAALQRGVWWSTAYGHSLFTLDDGLPQRTKEFFGPGGRIVLQATRDKCVFDPARLSLEALLAQDRYYAARWQAARAKNYPPKSVVPATSDQDRAREAGWCMSAATVALNFLQDTTTMTGMRKADPGFFKIDPSTAEGRAVLQNEITKHTRFKDWWNTRREELRAKDTGNDALIDQSTRFTEIFAWLNRSDQSARDSRAVQLLYVQGENRRCEMLMATILRQ